MTVFSYSFLSSDNSDLSCNRNVSVLLILLLSFFQFTPFPEAVLKKLRNEREGSGNRKKTQLSSFMQKRAKKRNGIFNISVLRD